jgi:hypothetical protein
MTVNGIIIKNCPGRGDLEIRVLVHSPKSISIERVRNEEYLILRPDRTKAIGKEIAAGRSEP